MLSMPPATTALASPWRMRSAARLTALSDDAHTLLTVSAGTLVGTPALMAAWRAGIWPIPAVMTVATITINRPDNRNALGTDTVEELRQAFDEAKHDEAVRVIVLTGAGKVFCAGADLEGFRLEISELDRYFQRRNLADLFLEMTEL